MAPGGWFNDNHIAYPFDNIQQSLLKSSEEDPKFLFIKPTVVHWINTLSTEKDHALTSFEMEKKNLIFMPVCKKK